MPFTLSHAAAVLPGIRRDGTGRGPLLPSALVAGSFAPDLTYFADSAVPGAMEFGEVTHSAAGVLTVDVLFAAAAVALWWLVREPLVGLCPSAWQGRVYACVRGRGAPRPRGRLLRDAAWFALSAVVGAATHVVWDAFTHHDRWGVRLVPGLGGSIGGRPAYQLLQYGSSAVALVVVAWFTASALRRAQARPAPSSLPEPGRRGRWAAGALLGGCALLGIVHRCARWYAYHGRVDDPLDIVPTACFGAGAGLAVGMVLYAAWVRLRLHGPRPPAPVAPAAGRDRSPC